MAPSKFMVFYGENKRTRLELEQKARSRKLERTAWGKSFINFDSIYTLIPISSKTDVKRQKIKVEMTEIGSVDFRSLEGHKHQRWIKLLHKSVPAQSTTQLLLLFKGHAKQMIFDTLSDNYIDAF